MKLYLSVFLFFIVAIGYAQDISSNYKEKKVALRDTVVLDSAGINPKRFAILDSEGNSPNPFRVPVTPRILQFSGMLA